MKSSQGVGIPRCYRPGHQFQANVRKIQASALARLQLPFATWFHLGGLSTSLGRGRRNLGAAKYAQFSVWRRERSDANGPCRDRHGGDLRGPDLRFLFPSNELGGLGASTFVSLPISRVWSSVCFASAPTVANSQLAAGASVQPFSTASARRRRFFFVAVDLCQCTNE